MDAGWLFDQSWNTRRSLDWGQILEPVRRTVIQCIPWSTGIQCQLPRFNSLTFTHRARYVAVPDLGQQSQLVSCILRTQLRSRTKSISRRWL